MESSDEEEPEEEPALNTVEDLLTFNADNEEELSSKKGYSKLLDDDQVSYIFHYLFIPSKSYIGGGRRWQWAIYLHKL